MRDHIALFVNVTHDCNLACTYCYERFLPKELKQPLSVARVKKLIQLCGRYFNSIKIMFHGGEPLMLPTSYYQQIIDFCNEYTSQFGTKFKYAMQSNATLLNDDYAKFIKQNNISYSISYDGLSTDKYRCKKERIISGISYLHKYNIPVSGIAVANDDFLKNIQQEYNHLKKIFTSGMKIAWIFGNDVSDQYNDDFIKVMKYLFLVWLYDKKPLRIQNFNELITMAMGKAGYMHACMNCEQNWLGIDSNGILGMCDFGVYPRELNFGHIDEVSDLADVLFSDNRLNLLKQISQRHRKCINDQCQYVGICTGGCNARIYSFNGNDLSNRDKMHCKFYHAMIPYVKDEIDKVTSTGLTDVINKFTQEELSKLK